MPVRYPILGILGRFGRLGLVDVAAKMIDASVDAIVKEQGEAQAQDLKKKKKAKRRMQKQSRRKR